MKNPRFTVRQRRKREGKTNYKKRLKLLLSSKPRLVVRKGANNIVAQIIEYEPKGDKIIVTAHSSALKKLGWTHSRKSVPAAYLLGMLTASLAKKKGCKEAVLDIGLSPSIKGSRIYAVVKGAVENGLDVPHSADILPSEDRITGKHIVEYSRKIKASGKQEFSKFDAESFSKNFEEIKKKLRSEK